MNLLETPVFVAGTGARTSLGLTSPATAAAIRAGIANFGEHPAAKDSIGNPYIVARATYIPDDLAGGERLAALAGRAAVEAVGGRKTGKTALPVFVGLPPVRPGHAESAKEKLTSVLRTELMMAGVNMGMVRWYPNGHAAGMMAMEAAWQAIRNGADFALAGGVDSYLDPDTLGWLESQDQVHSAGRENNAWGFVPGEAAGFVLLASAAAAKSMRPPPRLKLLAVAAAMEPNRIKTETVCLGEGLTELFRELGKGLLPGVRADHMYCDMNGEPYRADEYGFATLRAGEGLMHAAGFEAPASNWGDVGAASGPLYFTLAEASARKGYAPGPITVVFTSSESGRTLRLPFGSHAFEWSPCMPVTIKVNGSSNSLVHKGSTGISTATIPDVCKTPSPAGPIPIPYPNIAQSAMLAKGTTTVKVDGGMMAAVKGSEFSISNGDEAGTAGGVKSSSFIKEATWILYSFDVKLDGKEACRLTDKMFHNHENTVNMGGEIQAAVVPAPATPPAASGGESETDPGDCTKEEHKKLQDEVKAGKADVAKGGACKESDSAKDLKQKGAAWLRQATARSKINNKCYKGGDDGHQIAAASAWEHVGKCQRIASGK